MLTGYESISWTLAAVNAMATTTAGTGIGSEVVSVTLRMKKVMMLVPPEMAPTTEICGYKKETIIKMNRLR